MERNISKKIQLRDTLNPLMLDYGDVPAVDDEANLRNLFSKFDKVGRFWKSYRSTKKEMENIPLQSLIPINTISPARTGGVLWIFKKKKTFVI